jgi:hypothetical protein
MYALQFRRGRTSDRKFRLFAVACYRLFWHRFTDWRCLRAIEVAERFADCEASREELISAREAVRAARIGSAGDFAKKVAGNSGYVAAGDSIHAVFFVVEGYLALTALVREDADAWSTTTQKLLPLVHDIFANPVRPLPPRPESIAPLAEEIYAERWDLMPLLGEWLQERGFWTEGEHCLDPNIRHVKGCWVVDWITGRD